MGKRPGGGEGFIGKHYKAVPASKESTRSFICWLKGSEFWKTIEERKANKEEGENLRKADILQHSYLLQFYFTSQP